MTLAVVAKNAERLVNKVGVLFYRKCYLSNSNYLAQTLYDIQSPESIPTRLSHRQVSFR